jgi:hypothetical protein
MPNFRSFPLPQTWGSPPAKYLVNLVRLQAGGKGWGYE